MGYIQNPGLGGAWTEAARRWNLPVRSTSRAAPQPRPPLRARYRGPCYREVVAGGEGVGVVRAEVAGFVVENALTQQVLFGSIPRVLEGVGEIVKQVAGGGEVGCGCAVEEGWEVWGEETGAGPASAACADGVANGWGEVGSDGGVAGGAIRAAGRGESDDLVDQLMVSE